MLFDEQSKVIAISNSKGGIYNKEGIDTNALIQHAKEHKAVDDFPNVETITNEDLQFYFWKKSEVHKRLKEIMSNIFNSILSLSREKQLDLRTAAWMLGIKRIAEAQKTRGLYP